MIDAEAVRYDRQIRLWGKATQQQIMHTSVALHGIAGAAAEVTKNLVLAGVRAVAVADEGHVTDVDVCTNYLMQGEGGGTRGARALSALQRLNPYVTVYDAVTKLDGSSGPRVTMATVASVEDALPHAHVAVSGADIVAFHVTCGPTVLALFLYRRLPARSLAEQWRCLVAEPSLLAEKPRGYQRVVLALHVRTDAVSLGFAAAAAKAYEVVERLHLQQLTAADVQEVLQSCAHDAGSGDCVSDTIAGACVAQHLIRQISALDQPPDAQSYHWMLCECGAEVECLVGL
ncbi:ubiquitin activating enzyme, putative [Leishmania guyanensis]|uniref:Ubiquitin activating enzyme, putative n=1 Tax=Leishmania guyanensis TaxID=5670 RepID=A0A1E1IZW2_LEIGU|nr:ubiquitin activating enzyme, putative [Leishmania guyanensis]